MKKLILFGIMITFNFGVYAQQLISRGAIFHHLTTKDGLSSNKVVAVLQDTIGFYWIATQDGLNRFDGTNVKVFRRIRGDSNSLSNNHCTDLLKDREGNIWVATLDGLNCFDQKTGVFRRYYLSNSSFGATRINWIRSITEDGDENIWAAAFGLWRINERSGKVTYFSNYQPGLAKAVLKNPDEVYYDKFLNGIWCNDGDGILYFDILSNQFFNSNNNPENWKILKVYTNFIFTIDSRHVLWFVQGQNHELCYTKLPADNIQHTGIFIDGGIKGLTFDQKGMIWIMRYSKCPILYSPEARMIDSNFLQTVHSQPPLSEIVHFCYNDAEGNLWLGSSQGVSIFDSRAPTREYLDFDRFSTLKNNAPSEMFTGFITQDSNKIWLYDMGGLYQIKRDSILQWKSGEPLFGQEVTGGIATSDSILFIATVNSVYRYNTIRQKIEKRYKELFRYRANMVGDDHQNIWVASWSKGLYKFDKDLNLLYHFTESTAHIAYDHLVGIYFDHQSDSIFVGFNEGRGYSCINASNNGVVNHSIPLTNQSEKNVANTITSFLKDHVGTLWIGTFGGGLFYRNPGANNFQSIRQEDGLKSDFINAIEEDNRHNIWVSTSSGINILTNGDRVVTSAGNEIELPNNDFFQNLRVINGDALAVYGEKGLIIYHPSRMLMDEKPGKILISDFSVFGKSLWLLPGARIHLNHDQNFFSLKFSLLKADPLQPVLYAYKLEGFDKDWVRVDKLQIANYTNVPPGNYIFKVKAAGLNGKWIHTSKDIMLTISPPFWKTFWFIALAVLVIAFSIWSLYRYRVRQLKKVYEVRNKISHDLHDEIGSTLSGVALLSELTQQRLEQHKDGEALKHLQNITGQAQSMIQKMSDIVWTINPLNDSLDKVIAKLNNYAVNVCTAAGIQFHLFVDERMKVSSLNMLARENIYLFSKEAIHNSVKYSGAVNIYFFLHHHLGKNNLVIQDDGNGFDPQLETTGNGLVNMKARAKALNGELYIRSENSSGTSIELTW